MRVAVRVAIGAVILLMGLLKWIEPPLVRVEWHPAYRVLIAVLSIFEMVLGVWLASGRRPIAAATLTMSLGVAFVGWQILSGPTGGALPSDCGCFGPLKLRYHERVLAGACVGIAGFASLLLAPAPSGVDVQS